VLKKGRNQRSTQGGPARTVELYEEEGAAAAVFLLTMKPTLYVANVAERGFHDNPCSPKSSPTWRRKGRPSSPSARPWKAEIADLEGTTARVPARPRADRAAARSRHPRRLQAARPGNLFHGRAQGSARLDHPRRRHGAAGRRRHSPDFEKGFIRAEVIAFGDFIACKGEHGAKDTARCDSRARNTSSTTVM